jgi:hypothetical protein
MDEDAAGEVLGVVVVAIVSGGIVRRAVEEPQRVVDPLGKQIAVKVKAQVPSGTRSDGSARSTNLSARSSSNLSRPTGSLNLPTRS